MRDIFLAAKRDETVPAITPADFELRVIDHCELIDKVFYLWMNNTTIERS